jgi:hypothetical protein
MVWLYDLRVKVKEGAGTSCDIRRNRRRYTVFQGKSQKQASFLKYFILSSVIKSVIECTDERQFSDFI